MRHVFVALACFMVASCATTTPVEPAATSKSGFDGAVFTGNTVTLGKPTPGEESYRIYHRAATGFVTLSAVRSGVQEEADAHCAREGKFVHSLEERAAKPPFILGNFPRIELVFECVKHSGPMASSVPTDKYQKIETLKKLLDSGAITQGEFDGEKAKILASP